MDSVMGKRHGQGQAAQKAFEIGGILPGRVDADVELGLRMLPMQTLELLLQCLIAGLGFHDCERLGGGLMIGPAKRHAMTVARGVDADADALERRRRTHGFLRDEEECGWEGHPNRLASQRAVSLLRSSFGEVILVISGQRRMMYQSLEPKIGGNNLF